MVKTIEKNVIKKYKFFIKKIRKLFFLKIEKYKINDTRLNSSMS